MPKIHVKRVSHTQGGENADWLYRTALEARANPTNAERRLWGALHGRGIDSYFKRERVFGRYCADLYCPTRKAAITVDGRRGHATDADRAYDARRDAYFASRGITVIRVTNSDVTSDAGAVAQRIAMALRLEPVIPPPHYESHEATLWLESNGTAADSKIYIDLTQS